MQESAYYVDGKVILYIVLLFIGMIVGLMSLVFIINSDINCNDFSHPINIGLCNAFKVIQRGE